MSQVTDNVNRELKSRSEPTTTIVFIEIAVAWEGTPWPILKDADNEHAGLAEETRARDAEIGKLVHGQVLLGAAAARQDRPTQPSRLKPVGPVRGSGPLSRQLSIVGLPAEPPARDKPGPLLGREEELRFLLHAWQLAAAGQGRVVLLSGEAGIYGRDPRSIALVHLAQALWLGSHPDQAVRAAREATARAAGHPLDLAYALLGAGWGSQFRREAEAHCALAADAITCSIDEVFSAFLARATILRAWASAEQVAKVSRGPEEMRQALDGCRLWAQASRGRIFLP